MSAAPNPSARPARFRANMNNLASAFLALMVLLMVNYLAYRHYVLKDFSQNHFYELSPRTVQLLKSLKEPVHITLYSAPSDKNPSNIKTEIDNLLKQYHYVGGDKIVVARVDPDRDLPQAEELSRKFNFKDDDNVVIFEYADRNRIVRHDQLAVFDSNVYTGPARVKAFLGEAEFTSAIQALVEGRTARVYFLTGHGERDYTDVSNLAGYGKLAGHLKHVNIEIAPLNLMETAEVPDDAQVVVIAGPKVALSTPEISAITTFLEKKGKVILLQDPVNASGLEPLAQKYGIKIENDIAIATAKFIGGSELTSTVTITGYADHPVTRILRGLKENLNMPSARSLTLLTQPDGTPNPKVTALLTTPNPYWGETNLTDTSPVFDPTKDIAGPLVISAVYDGGEIPGEGTRITGARLLVIGSSSFLSNRYQDEVATDLFSNCINWMLNKDHAIGIGPKTAAEFPLNIAPRQAFVGSVLACTLMPGLALLAGIFIWYARRR
jgi:ABC-type uncharacterized transport system involved in gliding motility auxiliary subunit